MFENVLNIYWCLSFYDFSIFLSFSQFIVPLSFLKIFHFVLISHNSVKSNSGIPIISSGSNHTPSLKHLCERKVFSRSPGVSGTIFLSFSLYDIFLLILATRLIWLPAKELVLSLNCFQSTKSVWQLNKSNTRVTLFFGVENYEIEQIMPSRVQEASIYLKSIVTMNFCSSCWS